MIFPKAKKIAEELDWHKTQDSVFGLYKGYFFTVADASLLSSPQSKFVTATLGNLTEEQKLQIKTELDIKKKTLKFTNFEIGDNSIFFQFAESFAFTKLKTVYDLFDFLVDLFKKLQLPEQNKCHNCGTNQNINHYILNESGVILCSTCFKQTESRFEEVERERISKEKNYLTGFLGTLVFSIPGIIAWVLIAVYLEKLASAMAMVIAFLGIRGYDYFKGRHGKLTKYLIVLSNIICILMANALTVTAILLKEGLTITQALTEFRVNQTAKEILYKNTMISFILAFLVWIWVLFILKDKKLTVKLADKFRK